MDAQDHKLGAVAQGRQEGLELGVSDPAGFQVQAVQGGCSAVQQDLEGLQTEIGQFDAPQFQVSELSGVWISGKVIPVRI